MFWSILGAIALGVIVCFAIYIVAGCFYDDEICVDYDNDQTKK